MEKIKLKSKIFLYLISFTIIIYFFHRGDYLKNINMNKYCILNEEEGEKKDGEVLHLIKFNFTTKHNPKESEDPITYLLLNDIRIPISLGTPNQTIFASLRFNDYPFYLTSPSIKIQNEEEEKNIFIKNSSNTYNFLSNDKFFYKSLLLEAEKANETFYFNEDIINNFTFYYAIKMGYNQSGGVVGLCLEDSNMNLHSGMNFFTQLKNKKVISYKTYFFNFNSANTEEGELIIGAYPHEYSKDKYQFENFHYLYGYDDTTYKIFGFIFDEINIGGNKIILTTSSKSEGNKKLMTADLKIEFGFILAPSILEENITNQFIDLYKCNAYISNHQEIYGNKLLLGDSYKYYVCDNNYNINSKITFLSREMQYTLELNEKDLFMTYKNKKYFNIVFLNHEYTNRNWIFGKPLFRKYNWVFDPDKKLLGLYEDKKNEGEEKDERNNIKMIIILTITILIFLIVLGVFIYQFFIKKLRKVRQNEIKDDYDYSSPIN